MKEQIFDRTIDGDINIKLTKTRRWVADKRVLSDNIISIVEAYSRSGYTLTLRQLYYQLVAADAIPNHDVVYKKLSGILNDLRYGGYIDWTAIEDRGRTPHITYSVEDVEDALIDTVRQYRLDRQRGQVNIVEVATEKDAISGILKKITTKYHVRLLVMKGYGSSSAMYQAYLRYVLGINSGKRITILYFGDHDPSGLDMIRDIRDRITAFLVHGNKLSSKIRNDATDWYDNLLSADAQAELIYESEDWSKCMNKLIKWCNKDEKKRKYTTTIRKAHKQHGDFILSAYVQTNLFEVVPVGLTMEQIKELKPPPNPAKMDDPRSKWYVKQFGQLSWEVDAIKPNIMEDIVSNAIEEHIDMESFKEMIRLEEVEKSEIEELIEQYKKDKQ